ncbi:MAG TPA: multidrug MFS transporter [Acidilobales archaeon]|nr:multidrug MFS transporter [Acidilobales archaeon]
MVRVYVDDRERNSNVPELLKAMGVTVIFKKLNVGDYMVSDEVIIERKRVDDLVKSVFDGRFFDQISRLVKEAQKPFLIVEGNLRQIKLITDRWKAIQAALLTALLKFNIQYFNTYNAKETAEVIKYLAERVSKPESRQYFAKVRALSKPKAVSDISEWQLFILQSLPYVGPKTAQKLLEKFGTVRAVFNASITELARVEGLNESKASRIVQILTTPYRGSKGRQSGATSIMEFMGSKE